MTTRKRRYGWRPDLPDQRDHRATLRAPRALPERVSLRAAAPAVLDQGWLGSCTAHAGAVCYMMAGEGNPLPSRLKLYWDARAAIAATREDSGAYLRDMIKALAKRGAAREDLWPYVQKNFATRPPQAAVRDAAKRRIVSYQRLAPSQYRAALALGQPFVIGFTVYESFEGAAVAKTGVVPLPGPKERALGGHAVAVIGYKPIGGMLHYEVRNSWGAAWGDKGNCWMPATYIENLDLADDAWVIRA